jgi:hypothetical protein
MALKHAFEAGSITALARKILRGRYEPLPDAYSEPTRRLVAAMLQLKPSARPPVAAILSAPFLRPHVERYAADCAARGVAVPYLDTLWTPALVAALELAPPAAAAPASAASAPSYASAGPGRRPSTDSPSAAAVRGASPLPIDGDDNKSVKAAAQPEPPGERRFRLSVLHDPLFKAPVIAASAPKELPASAGVVPALEPPPPFTGPRLHVAQRRQDVIRATAAVAVAKPTMQQQLPILAVPSAAVAPRLQPRAPSPLPAKASPHGSQSKGSPSAYTSLLQQADAILPHGLALHEYTTFDAVEAGIQRLAASSGGTGSGSNSSSYRSESLDSPAELPRSVSSGSVSRHGTGRSGGVIDGGAFTAPSEEPAGAASGGGRRQQQLYGPRDPPAYRIEALRAHLAARLGTPQFIDLYRQLHGAVVRPGEAPAPPRKQSGDALSLEPSVAAISATLKRALPSGGLALLPLVYQLIYSEWRLYSASA